MSRGNFLISIFFLLLFSALALASPKVLNVGVALRLNDKFNGTVNQMAAGIETAKTLFESEHPGVKINLKRFAHEEDLASVVAASQQIIDARVPAVIGGELSEESIVFGDRLNDKKVVFMTPTSSNPKVTENKPYVFRACFSDSQVAEQLAKFVVKQLKPGAVGLIHNISSPYTDYLSQRFIETYQKEVGPQGAPLYEQKMLRETAMFDKEIQSFIDHHVTHVVILTHQDDLLHFVAQASNKNFFPVYIGSDGWGTNEVLLSKLVTGSANGSKFVAFRNNYWKEEADSPLISRFRKESEKQAGQKPTAWHAISFDAAWTLFTAMNQAKNPNGGDDIRRAMLKLRHLKLTTSSDFSFGPDNSPKKDLYIYSVSKNGIQYEATLK